MTINAKTIRYIPISTDRDAMEHYLSNDFLQMVYDTYETYYPKIGYHPPWIGYFALHDDKVVGVGGYKGQPRDNQIEIAYGTVPEFEGLGVSSATCAYLIRLALSQEPGLRVTARTLMEDNASTSILKKNGFVYVGIVNDPEDGDVWEWEYQTVRR